MKKYLILLTLAVLAACAKEAADDLRPADGHYTMTVQASKVGTKALDLVGSDLNATWAKDEEVSVYNVTQGAALSGTLKAQSSGPSTTLKGELTGTIEENDKLTLKFLSPSYGSQNGTLEYIESHCDYAEATVNVKSIAGTDITIKEASASFQNKQAIVKFTLKQKVDNSDLEIPAATALTINDGTNDYTVRPASATNVLFVAIPATGTVILTTTVGGISYSYEKTGAGLLASKYYEITVKMNRALVNLASITGNITLLDDDIVTGTLGSNRKISIADGATVTLNGVSINASGTWTSGDYAGLTCEGDATIILSGENILRGIDDDYPGIHIAENKTLTIRGTGSLDASGNPTGNCYSAGIGGVFNSKCGNIVIEGGTITATGGNEGGAAIGGAFSGGYGYIIISGGTVTATAVGEGAGIGSGYSSSGSVGDILISGGTITATGGDNAAGIGSGFSSSCGDITIESTVTRVTATKGSGATNSIGAGNSGTCGTVTIGGVVGAISTSPYTYIPGALSGKFSVSSTKQVYFSQGNLKYSNGTWSFHTNQYDMCFTSEGSVSANYTSTGTFDLFGYGTSGYNDKYPYMTSMYDDYYQGDIAGTEYDWGTNAISNGGNTANSGWRTLTQSEWSYLLNSRSTTSDVRYAKATVNGVAGLIILPDDWSTSYFDLSSIANDDSKFFSTIQFDQSVWENTFEAHGAVFLPVFGFRDEATINNASGFLSYYWSSTYQGYDSGPNAYCAYYLTLGEYYDDYYQSGVNYVATNKYGPIFAGAFVRLVRDVD